MMPTQLHSQARMMNYIAIVTSLVTFFRAFGGIIGLAIMSSVVNNKVVSALSPYFTSGFSSSSIDSLSSIQSLPPEILALVQNAFSDGIRWAYIALLPFACISAIGSFFLREVKIERSEEERTESERRRNGKDEELGNVATGGNSEPSGGETAEQTGVITTHPPRIKVYGPVTAVIWCIQALADKMGWRK